MLILAIFKLPRVPENPSLSDSSIPPCISSQASRQRNLLVGVKALGYIDFCWQVSLWTIKRMWFILFMDSKNVHLLILVWLPDGTSLVYHHISTLPTNGHTESFNVWESLWQFSAYISLLNTCWKIEWIVWQWFFKISSTENKKSGDLSPLVISLGISAWINKD